ncbi:hypothetical protein FF1_045161 [Malus domestica]
MHRNKRISEGATPLEEFEESEKSALQTQIKIVLQDDRTDRGMAPHDWAVDGLVPLAVSCKVLVLDDPEYVHYNAKTIDLTSSQDKRFMLLKKTNVSNSANQYKCLARSQGREIFSSSCNALPIVTDDIAVTKRILGLPIKHGARVSQKDKFGLTFFFVILLLGWIPGVNAADENALLQGCTCTWICIIIITIALVYFAYKIYSLPPPEPYLFSEKVRIWINGELNVEVYDDEGILVGSWRCALFTANGNAVDITEWVTNLLNFVLEIHVPQEDGRVKEISFNQMDDPEFIGMPKDVYLHNLDTGLLRYIGRSVPQNDAPSDRDILRAHTNVTLRYTENSNAEAVTPVKNQHGSRSKKHDNSRYTENSNPNVSPAPKPTASPASKSAAKSHKSESKNANPVVRSPGNKIRERKLVVAKKKSKKENPNVACKCKEKGNSKMCLCVEYENLQASQEEFFKKRNDDDVESESLKESDRAERELEEAIEEGFRIQDLQIEDGSGDLDPDSELGCSTIKRRRDKLLEEARKSVPERGKVMYLVQAFEKLFSIPSSKDLDEQNGEEEAAEEIGKKAEKWTLPGLQPPPKTPETQVSSSSFFPSDLCLTLENLGLDPRPSVSSSWDGSLGRLAIILTI